MKKHHFNEKKKIYIAFLNQVICFNRQTDGWTNDDSRYIYACLKHNILYCTDGNILQQKKERIYNEITLMEDEKKNTLNRTSEKEKPST